MTTTVRTRQCVKWVRVLGINNTHNNLSKGRNRKIWVGVDKCKIGLREVEGEGKRRRGGGTLF